MKTICIDIDGTICRYDGWRGHDHFGIVLPGAREAIKKLHEDGWYIIIFSTRSKRDSIKKFLENEKIYFDSINENPYQPDNALGGKPIADVYLDDKAVTFKGDWATAYEEIINFQPWEKESGRNV